MEMPFKKGGKFRVVLVEDDVLIRETLARYINSLNGFEVIGEAGGGIAAVRLCEKKMPDVVLLDAVLPELHGLEVLKVLAPKLPQTRFLVISGTRDEILPMRFLQRGAHGYIRKTDSLDVMTEALHTLTRGGFYFMSKDNHLIQHALSKNLEGDNESLTMREREVLQLIAEGNATKQIASRLSISVKTAETHRAKLMQKLDIHDVAGLTRYAIRQGWVSI